MAWNSTKIFLLCFILQAITILLATGQQQQQLPGQNEFLEATKLWSKKNTLNYNDSCSYEDEKRREKIGIKILDIAFNLDFGLFKPLAKEMNEMSKNSGEFCNALLNMQCTSDNICDCGNGEALGMTISSIRENNACRLEAGSSCAPQDSPSQGIDGQKPELRCQTRSECVLKNTNTLCTTEAMQQTLLRTFDGSLSSIQSNPKLFLAHTRTKMAEGICTCSGSPAPKSPYALYKIAVDRLISMRSLEYGNVCVPEDKLIGQAINQARDIKKTTELPAGHLETMANDLNELKRNAKKSCDPIEILECSLSTCKCPESRFLGLPVKTIHEDNKCRLAIGSACSPKEFLPRIDYRIPDLKCQSGSECVVASGNSGPCTSTKMEHELQHVYGINDALSVPNVIKKISEPFCICSSGTKNSNGIISTISLLFSVIMVLIHYLT